MTVVPMTMETMIVGGVDGDGDGGDGCDDNHGNNKKADSTVRKSK